MSSAAPGPSGQHGSWGMSASTGPDELEALPPLRASRFPRWALVLIGLLATLLLVSAAGYTAWRYNASRPQVVVTVAPSHSPWALVPPLRVGDWSRDVNVAATPTPNPQTHTSTVTATYSRNGQNGFVLLMSRPETDGKKFMAEMGMNSVVATDDGWCGTSVDSNSDGCAVLRDSSAILVVDLSGMTRTDLMQQAHAFATTLSGS